ncbi:hypothetical protein [Rhodococcus oryzae]|uniref:hypothetical protein n=1 Tax=Rhodococcus oryzae TaxID=2571143 RepID=UPI0037AF4C29
MGAAVESGDLYFEPKAAQRCAQRCAEFIDHLEKLQFEVKRLGKIDGFGDRLPSGVALATKFEKKASGGDYSMDQAITDHIKVVLEMQQTFEKIEAMYAASEDRGTAGINSAGAPL